MLELIMAMCGAVTTGGFVLGLYNYRLLCSRKYDHEIRLEEIKLKRNEQAHRQYMELERFNHEKELPAIAQNLSKKLKIAEANLAAKAKELELYSKRRYL